MAYSQFGRRDLYHPHQQNNRPARTASGWKVLTLFAVFVLSVWSAGVTFYLIYRDDALMFLASRQTELVQSYDAQLTTLETEIERLKSLKLIDQERVDRAVLDLGRRQALLERRQKELAHIPPLKAGARAFGGDEVTGSIPPKGPALPAAPSTIPKPSPISDTIIFMPAPDRSAELESRPEVPRATRLSAFDVSNPVEARMAELARGLDRLHSRQAESLSRLEETFEGWETRARAVLAEFGMSAQLPPARRAAIGGPLLPFVMKEDAFEQQLARVRANAGAMSEIGSVIDRVPLRRPVPAGAELTSGFGPRLDPFVKQYAFHSGLDLKGEPGDLVRATAAGRITLASYQGGYGLLVEVDHGNGLATRYGHLSAIDVEEGQTIQAGDAVGRIGTTGRSTGPHLHYEVRVAGDPVDPQRYLRAGVRLLVP